MIIDGQIVSLVVAWPTRVPWLVEFGTVFTLRDHRGNGYWRKLWNELEWKQSPNTGIVTVTKIESVIRFVEGKRWREVLGNERQTIQIDREDPNLGDRRIFLRPLEEPSGGFAFSA